MTKPYAVCITCCSFLALLAFNHFNVDWTSASCAICSQFQTESNHIIFSSTCIFEGHGLSDWLFFLLVGSRFCISGICHALVEIYDIVVIMASLLWLAEDHFECFHSNLTTSDNQINLRWLYWNRQAFILESGANYQI